MRTSTSATTLGSAFRRSSKSGRPSRWSFGARRPAAAVRVNGDRARRSDAADARRQGRDRRQGAAVLRRHASRATRRSCRRPTIAAVRSRAYSAPARPPRRATAADRRATRLARRRQGVLDRAPTGSRSAATRARRVVVAQNDVSRKHAEVCARRGRLRGSRLQRERRVRERRARRASADARRVADVIRVGSEEFRFYADVPRANARGRAVEARLRARQRPPRSAAARTLAVRGASGASRRPVARGLRSRSRTLVRRRHSSSRFMFRSRTSAAAPTTRLSLDDDSVSETHAKLQRRDDGWYRGDLGSTNGTLRRRPAIHRRAPARRRADVRFGGVKMIFRPTGAVRPTPKGTRAIASVDRSTAVRGAIRRRVPAPSPPTRPEYVTRSPGLPAWVWGVVVLAVGGGRRFLLAESLMVRLLHAARTDVGMIRSGNEDNYRRQRERRSRAVRRRGRHGRPRRRRSRERDGGADHRARAGRASRISTTSVAAERVSDALRDGEPQHPRPHDHRGRQAGDGNDGVGAHRVAACDT